MNKQSFCLYIVLFAAAAAAVAVVTDSIASFVEWNGMQCASHNL